MKSSEEELGVLVERFMRAMHRYDGGRTLPLLHSTNLTTPQLAVLEFTRTPRLVSDVAAFLGLSRPATSQLVDKLARGGLVRRSLGTIDRRQRYVALSAKGAGLVDRVAAARAARFRASLASVPNELARRFAQVLAELVSTLKASGQPDEPRQTRRSRR
jgi:DNA-binding MarR family transcriptional regulator